MIFAKILNASALLLGVTGAGLVWWVGRREGPGLPFLADAEGQLLEEIRVANARRQRLKDQGMGLVAISFLLQFLALFI